MSNNCPYPYGQAAPCPGYSDSISSPQPTLFTDIVNCIRCGGSGKAHSSSGRCHHCGGSGKQRRPDGMPSYDELRSEKEQLRVELQEEVARHEKEMEASEARWRASQAELSRVLKEKDAVVKAEREACAQLVDVMVESYDEPVSLICRTAAAIRARGGK